jgi:hypothetical protein
MPAIHEESLSVLRDRSDQMIPLLSVHRNVQDMLLWRHTLTFVFEQVCSTKVQFVTSHYVAEFFQVHEPPNDRFVVLGLKAIIYRFDWHIGILSHGE